MPAGARLSASETQQFNLKEQIHALKTQQGATLESMAHALRTFQERTTIVDTFQSLFPQHARRAIQKALTSTPAAIHEHVLETFMTLVSTHHFPVEEWDVEQVLDQFPMIPICALNYDEESELEGEYLATRIAATMTGYYSNAPSWEEIQQALGPTIQVPTCFTDPHHQCRVNLGILTERCQQLRRPVSDFPTILRIMYHDTGTLFLDISYAYDEINPAAKVVITTIQRLYSMLKGEAEFDAANEEGSGFDSAKPWKGEPPDVVYNAGIPPEFFDFVIVDECHRSIYDLWAQVILYFDSFLVGLTATPAGKTVGFFNQNLVMQYGHDEAVTDGVNVDFDVYRIRTRISEQGATIVADETGVYVDKRHKLTRAERLERLNQDLTYTANELDRDVVSETSFARSYANSAMAPCPHASPTGKKSPRRSSSPRTILTPTTSSAWCVMSSPRKTSSARRSPTALALPVS